MKKIMSNNTMELTDYHKQLNEAGMKAVKSMRKQQFSHQQFLNQVEQLKEQRRKIEQEEINGEINMG